METTHSPLPWAMTDWKPNGVEIAIKGSNGQWIADCVVDQELGVGIENMKANAELIVRAVNSHAYLLAACKATLSMLDGSSPQPTVATMGDLETVVRAAIAKAEAQ